MRGCYNMIPFNKSVSDKEFKLVCKEINNISKIAEYFGYSESTIARRIKELGLTVDGRKNNPDNNCTDSYFKEICKNSQSMKQASEKLGIPFNTFKRRALKLGCYNTNQPGVGVERNCKSKYKVNEQYFNIWTPQMAYWYGFLVADGGIVTGTKNAIRLRLSSKYRFVLETFKKDVSFTGNIKDSKTKANSKSDKYYNYSELVITNKTFVSSLRNKGIVENKTFQDVKYIDFVPKQFKPYFLVGLFDGDGHISEKDGAISIAGNKVNVVSALNNLGFTMNKLRIEEKENYVDVNIRFREDIFIFYKIYLKSCKYIHTLNYKKERIKYFYNLQSKRHPEWV